MSSDPNLASGRKLTSSASGACSDFLDSANLSMQCAQFDEALAMYEQVLDLLDHLDAPDMSQVQECLSNLIDVYMFLGRPQDALAASKRLRETDAISKKDKHYIMVLLKTAAALERVGDLAESEKIIWEASTIAGEVLPPEDPIHIRVNRQVLEIHRKRKNKEVLDEAEKVALLEGQKKEPLSLRPAKRPTIEGGGPAEGEPDATGAPTDSEESSLPLPGFGLMNSNRLLVIVSVLLLMCAGLSAIGLTLGPRGTLSRKLTSHMPPGRYRAADNRKSVVFADDPVVELSNYDAQSTGTYRCLTGSWDDFASIVTGFMHSPGELWLQVTDAGLIDQDGTVLYAEDAPEFRIAQKMDWYADLAATQYKQTKLYPADLDKFQNTSGFKYSNPFSGKSDSASLQFKRFAAPSHTWTPQLKSGNAWEQEPQFRPGDIHCLCLDYCRFFVRGFDRYGVPITGSEPGHRLIIELKDGINITHNEIAENRALANATKRQNLHIFITDGPGVQILAQITRQLVPILLWSMLLLSIAVLAVSFIKGIMPKRIRMAMAVVCLLAVCLLLSWYCAALSDHW